MTKGVLDQFVRSHDDEHNFSEEEALAHVALTLADALEKCHVSQRELASRIGVSEARISQILRADSNPTIRTVARIGKALGVNLRFHFGGRDVVVE